MLQGVKPYSVKVGLIKIPFRPFVEFFPYKRISVLNVVIHQVIVIAFLIMDHFFPVVSVFRQDLINVRFHPFSIIYSAEAGKVPFEI